MPSTRPLSKVVGNVRGDWSLVYCIISRRTFHMDRPYKGRRTFYDWSSRNFVVSRLFSCCPTLSGVVDPRTTGVGTFRVVSTLHDRPRASFTSKKTTLLGGSRGKTPCPSPPSLGFNTGVRITESTMTMVFPFKYTPTCRGLWSEWTLNPLLS